MPPKAARPKRAAAQDAPAAEAAAAAQAGPVNTETDHINADYHKVIKDAITILICIDLGIFASAGFCLRLC